MTKIATVLSSSKRTILLSCAFAGTVLTALPAQATLVTYAHTFDNSPGGGYRDYGTQTGNMSSASVSTELSSAAASAQYGILKTSAKAGISGQSSASAYVSASFIDRLTLNADGRAGQKALVTFAYYIDYDIAMSATGGGYSNGSVSFMAQTGYDYDWYLDYRTTGDGSYTMYEERNPDGSQGRTYNVPRSSMLYHTTEITLGNPFETKFELNISTGASSPPGGATSYLFDAGHSAYWAGIVSASVNGTALKDYEIASQSGTDYSHSFVPNAEVPEPGTMGILGLGLGLVSLTARRARRRPV